jgi:hypothetical protein
MPLASKTGKRTEVRGSSIPQYVKDMSSSIKEMAISGDSLAQVRDGRTIKRDNPGYLKKAQ